MLVCIVVKAKYRKVSEQVLYWVRDVKKPCPAIKMKKKRTKTVATKANARREKGQKLKKENQNLIERELAQKFTQQIHVDANKFTGKYLEEELEPEEENDFPELTQN